MDDTLIERLEAASGPDRELDLAIYEQVTIASGYSVIREGGAFRVERAGDGWFITVSPDMVLAYTASLDAAMGLVPIADWPWNITMATAYGSASVMPCDGKSTGIHDKRGGHSRGAATPVLALCIAALRAQAGEKS